MKRKQTIITIITAIVATLVTFGVLDRDTGDKIIDVAQEIIEIDNGTGDTMSGGLLHE